MSQPWRSHLKIALNALKRGENVKAKERIALALDLAPDQPEVLLTSAKHLLSTHDFRGAVLLLKEVIAKKKTSIAAIAMLVRTLGLNLGQLEEAFCYLHQGIQDNPQSTELLVIQGELYLEENAIDKARATFAQALKNSPTLDAAMAGLARTYNAEGIRFSESGDLKKSITAFKKAIDFDPNWGGPLVNLGVVYERIGELEDALLCFENALECDPTNPIAYFNLGTTAHQLGRLDEALCALEYLLDLDPDYPHLRISLANILGDQKEFDAAIALLHEELEVNPYSVEAWTALGLAHTCSGNSGRGEECLLRALSYDPKYMAAYHNLAVIYMSHQRKDEARRILQRAYSYQPKLVRQLVREESILADFIRDKSFQ